MSRTSTIIAIMFLGLAPLTCKDSSGGADGNSTDVTQDGATAPGTDTAEPSKDTAEPSEDTSKRVQDARGPASDSA